ncbi:hypothetical protein KO561_12800 [Radiobacillus kanasensis]|uniref:hypothetical protein n=1 Tax=Radiobacillus kanasensis TaxID=2844358 RepID=UPI001E485FA3|nr:hypothetical protein [Radiobacillus kanasensis]UFT98081.1 hypothetical protein KO561_12800 [Radiobacillus kanasensis]
MSNEKHIQPPNINLDDLIRLSHLEILDYLIKRAAEDAENKDGEFSPEDFAEIISEHYKNLFTKDFTARYEKLISDHFSVIRQLFDER